MTKLKEIDKVKAKLGVRESQEKWLKHLESEVKDLAKQRKLYTLQSEWHKIMYGKTLVMETLKKAMA
jgi:hypothetical protein